MSVRSSIDREKKYVAGIELAARNSLKRDAEIDEYFQKKVERDSVDDQYWSWSYLRNQFSERNLEELYKTYMQRLRRSYLSVFLPMLTITTVLHAIVVLLSQRGPDEYSSTVDIIVHVGACVLCIIILGLCLNEKIVTRFEWLPIVASCTAVTLLVLADLSVSIFESTQNVLPPVRPSRAEIALLACYIFLPMGNKQACVLGMSVTGAHLFLLGTVTYRLDSRWKLRLVCDAVFFAGMNVLGIYFRLINEVTIRRTFLDRRACLETTEKLKYEKEQEERLMLSILPQHTAEKMKEDIRSIFFALERGHGTSNTNLFDDIYVEEHNNVSILYADVVKFTQMTEMLKPVIKLVETLNELFGRFDKASEYHKVLRIKFLGDCYYCVSGVPTPNPKHAQSCVDLGLDMIAIIKDVRLRKQLDIDMRIGVHSGNIIGGVLGAAKWQYDIWSRDVTIANLMETTGEPGKVHVTRQTLDHLNGAYQYEATNRGQVDYRLREYGLETFLIGQESRRNSAYVHANGMPKSSLVDHRSQTVGTGKDFMRKHLRRSAFMDSNVQQYRYMLLKADENMAKSIAEMPLGQWNKPCSNDAVLPVILLFRNPLWELPFLMQRDPVFMFYVATSAFVLGLIVIIQSIMLPVWHLRTMIIYVVIGVVITLLVFATWKQSSWRYFPDPKAPDESSIHNQDYESNMDQVSPKLNRLNRCLHWCTSSVIRSALIRTIIYICITVMLSTSALFNIIYCGTIKEVDTVHIDNVATPHYIECIPPWHITQCVSLALFMGFLFFRIHFLLKLFFGFSVFGLYSWLVWDARKQAFMEGESWSTGFDSRLAHIVTAGILFGALHTADRQTEYVNRLDFRWKRQLQKEQHGAEDTRNVNWMLLKNILPKHVAEVYLNTNRSTYELYHEEYESVAVMFASMTDYDMQSGESNVQLSQVDILKVLNKILCEFDNLLYTKRKLRVEKIKMAGWTFMAACGLDPGRKESVGITPPRGRLVHRSQTRSRRQRPSDQAVLVMVEFAVEMMNILRVFNDSVQQNFNLRIGISHGEVTAGVVGSNKPLYDIWGAPVNMASRMDSTGVPGMIQVTENTAQALHRLGVRCNHRGLTKIKGAGLINTYFVDLNEDLELVTRIPNMLPGFHSEPDFYCTRL